MPREKPQRSELPEAVDREKFTAVMRKLLATPPLPKAAITRKHKLRTAHPKAQ